MACSSVCAELNAQPSALPSITSFLCTLGAVGEGALQGGSPQDGTYMRIHGMQVLASTLESAIGRRRTSDTAPAETSARRKALSRILLWLLSEVRLRIPLPNMSPLPPSRAAASDRLCAVRRPR